MRGWSDSVASLVTQGRVPAEALPAVRWRELFGQLVANTNMHPGKLSFFAHGTRIQALAPAYDMAPALYVPVHGHLREPPFTASVPAVERAPIWDAACAAAAGAWATIAADDAISDGFRQIAAANEKLVREAVTWTALLSP
jgi:hypothetical protein